MNTENEKTHTEKKGSLKNAVLERIEKEKVCPKSRWSFLCINYSVWILWIVTITVGAIAVSEMIYLSMHSGFEFFEITHAGLLPFILDGLPYVWLVAFVLMVLIAYYDMRKTRRGYRYPLWQIVGSSLVFTVIGGMTLNATGVNNELDEMVDHMMPGYMSAEEWQEELWMHPEEGRLSGYYDEEILESGQMRFIDRAGNEWSLHVYELPPEHLELLRSGSSVRLIGEKLTDREANIFYTCGVMPWMPDEGHTLETLRASRSEVKGLLERYSPPNNMTGSQIATRSPLRCGEVIKEAFHANY